MKWLTVFASMLLFSRGTPRTPAAIRSDAQCPVVQPPFQCSSSCRQLRVTANHSWLAISVLGASPSFTGHCSLYVDFAQPNATLAQQQHQVTQPAILVKIDDLQLGRTAGFECDNTGNSINAFSQKNLLENAGYICADSPKYMWASNPIELRFYLNYTYPFFSAAFSFKVAQLINVCRDESNSTVQRIDDELYVFAPGFKYSGLPPNNEACSSKAVYTLSFATNSSAYFISQSVLVAPQNGSCCTLLLDGRLCGEGCNQSVSIGNLSTLIYECKDDGGDNPGFTLRVAAMPVTAMVSLAVPTSDELTEPPPSESLQVSTAISHNGLMSSSNEKPLDDTASYRSTPSASDITNTAGCSELLTIGASVSTSHSPAPTTPFLILASSSPSDSIYAISESTIAAVSVGCVLGVVVVVAVATVTAKCLGFPKCSLFVNAAGVAMRAVAAAYVRYFNFFVFARRLPRVKEPQQEIRFSSELQQCTTKPVAISPQGVTQNNETADTDHLSDLCYTDRESILLAPGSSFLSTFFKSACSENLTTTSDFVASLPDMPYSGLEFSYVEEHEYGVISDYVA